MNKQSIRKLMLQVRKNLPENIRIQKSYDIFKIVTQLPEFLNSKTIGIYYSLEFEVDTIKLINFSLAANKKIALPKIINNEKMEFILINDLNNLVVNKWNLKEPSDDIYLLKDEIDLIIVPIVAFDSLNNRIGYGKGYYDRYLNNFKGYKIGLAFSEQLLKKPILVDKFDIKLNKVVFI